jgi:hypothetical protein
MPTVFLLCALLASFDSGPAALAQDKQDSNELILGNFDRPEDTRLWEVNGGATMTFEPRDPTDRNKSCKLIFNGTSYGGISSFRQPKDWSAYEVLSFVVWSPDRRGMGVRVDDDNSKKALLDGLKLAGLIGDDSSDFLYGGPDGDTLNGGDLNDNVYGQGGNDTLTGEDGNDRLVGGPGRDTFEGGTGDDTMTGAGGDDQFSGDEGNDTVYGDGGSDLVMGGDGLDTIYGGDDPDFLLGGAGRDTIYGDGGNDCLAGDEDSDSLFGGSGDDTLNGEGQSDGSAPERLCGLAIPDGGQIASNLLDGGDGSDDICVNPSASISIQTKHCEISPIALHVRVTAQNGGAGTVSSDVVDITTGNPISCSSDTADQATDTGCNITILQGETPTLDATVTGPAGSTFSTWTQAGTPCGSTTPCTIGPLTLDTTVGATFSCIGGTLAGCSITAHQHLDGTLSLSYGPHGLGRYDADGRPLPRKASTALGRGRGTGMHPWAETRSQGGSCRSLKNHCTAVENRFQSVKRRQALPEGNLPRNSRLETHRSR